MPASERVESRSDTGWPAPAADAVGGRAAAPSGPGAPYSCAGAGSGRVVLLEAATLGQGASSRAAGIVRSQGGTPTAVRLAEWSRAFYRASTRPGIDSGFVRQGYYLPCFTEADVATARARMAMQQDARPTGALDRRRRGRGPATRRWRREPTLGGTFLDDDGYIHPPRNVLAYTVALPRRGRGPRARRVRRPGDLGGRVTGVETSGDDRHRARSC